MQIYFRGNMYDFSRRPKAPKRGRKGPKRDTDPLRDVSWKFRKKALRIALWTAGALFGVGLIATALLFAWVAKDLPSPGKVNSRVIAESTKIYDRTGDHLLYEVHGEEKRTIIPYADIPTNVRFATIVLEDQDFYAHHGIKLSSIVRAALKDVLHRGVAQGGSTITQQFVKNSLLTNEKTIVRKLKEVILSIEIEQKFEKDEILAMYLNEIPYGSNAYGIESAALTFFGKPAKDLSLDEAAMLASLPQAPSRYSPYGSHTDTLIARKNLALHRMADLGYITREEADGAAAEKTLDKVQPQKDVIAAPHFVMYVKDYLAEKYGEQAMEEMGLRVYTTLDWDKQQEAERIVREQALANKEKWDAENAAMTAIDPKTGQVLVMVGSRGYFDEEIDGKVNVAIRDRQPGSSFKPYVYLAAFQKGYIPETMIYDVPTDFETAEGSEYTPQNYDGAFHGPLMLKEALGRSLNIPAVKTLYLVGVHDAISLAKSLGITTLNDESRYGLSLVLGGGEVKLVDHTNAYATLAAGGIRRDKTAILRVEDKDGNVLEEFRPSEGVRAIDEEYVAMLDHILSTNTYRAPTFGEQNPLRFDDRPVAAKTGTTNEFRDGWTMGYTPGLAVGVWAGNNDNHSMRAGADGSYIAAPIFREFMLYATRNTPEEKFPEYDPEKFKEEHKDEEWMKKPMLGGELARGEDLKVCKIPGKDDEYCLANKYCPDDEEEKKTFVDANSILRYVSRDDPRGTVPEKPDRDPQYKEWNDAVKDWYKDEDKKTILDAPPEDECREDDFSKYKPEVSLSVPGNTGQNFRIKVEADAPYGVDRLRLFVDGDEIASTGKDSLSETYEVPADRNGEQLSVKAVVKDDNGNEDSEEDDVSVSW